MEMDSSAAPSTDSGTRGAKKLVSESGKKTEENNNKKSSCC